MGEGGSEEKAVRNQKPVERREGAWMMSTLLVSGSGICPLGGPGVLSYQ